MKKSFYIICTLMIAGVIMGVVYDDILTAGLCLFWTGFFVGKTLKGGDPGEL